VTSFRDFEDPAKCVLCRPIGISEPLPHRWNIEVVQDLYDLEDLSGLSGSTEDFPGMFVDRAGLSCSIKASGRHVKPIGDDKCLADRLVRMILEFIAQVV
jgi:hypothetical protein